MSLLMHKREKFSLFLFFAHVFSLCPNIIVMCGDIAQLEIINEKVGKGYEKC